MMTTQPIEQTIIEFARGEPQAFTIIYNKYQPTLYLFAYDILNNDADAEDIIAEVFLKLWGGRASFDSSDNIRAYLYMMTRNACIDFLRRQKLKSKVQDELIYQRENEVHDSFTCIEIKSEVIEYVSSEIKKLSPRYRTVFNLSFIEGLKNGVVAEHLSISDQLLRNIKTHIRKVLKIKALHKNFVITILLFAQEMLNKMR